MAASDSASRRTPPPGTLSSAGFDRLFRDARIVSGRHLTVRVAPAPDATPRWGFAVSRRTFRSAVTRNRIKRRLRAAARTVSFPEPVHVAVVARRSALRASLRELHRDLVRALGRSVAREQND